MKKTIISFLFGAFAILSLAFVGTEIASIGFGNTLPSSHTKTTYKVYYRLTDNSIHWYNGINWVQIPNGTPTILGGQAFGFPANIGSTDAYRFGLTTNGTSRLTFGPTGRIYTNTATDLIADVSDSLKLKGATIDIDGSTKFANRIQGKKGSDVASANDLTLGAGNLFFITGATQINAITTTGWQAGSEVSLMFQSSPTVKNNTTGGGGTAVMLLAGGTDFSATSNDVLTLVYDGTSWVEKNRSVN